ncbi:MAG: class I adenylate-forming enzyme family protein, partial [Ramlibacter sp.]
MNAAIEGERTVMGIEQFLRNSARQFRHKVALVADGRRFTFGELDGASDRLAAVLAESGVARGDRVVVFMDNCWEAVVAIFAVMKAGAVLCPIHPSTKAPKLAWLLGHCRASAIILQDRLAASAMAALAEVHSVGLTVVSGSAVPPGLPNSIRFDEAICGSAACPLEAHAGTDQDLAMLIYTSGSTGLPKGVMITHQNAVASANSVISYLQNAAEDVILNALPISFSYGLYQVLMAAKVGATLVLEKSFVFPSSIFEKIGAERATGFAIVPAIASTILQMTSLRPGAFPHLRYITNAGSALPPSHAERLQELFPATKIYSMYGMTECHRGTWLPPDQLRARPGSVGIAIPNTEAYVVGDNGNVVAPGVVGELVIRGAHVMKGYWEDQEATDNALRPGPYPGDKLLYTGDLFRSDQDGYLYFVARKDDIIKTGGQKVSPKEVENAIYALPGILAVAVVGAPDPVLGMAIKAVIVLGPKGDLKARDVIRHCAR